MEKKKKAIVIGAGIAGMTTGIYLLDNGYDVDIYEKHVIAGGECTGWDRDGAYIDGCAHFIVGTNRGSDLYPLWEHVGALNENTVVHRTDYFCKYDIDGEIVTMYADLEKLEEEFLSHSIEDRKQIRRFINGIRAYQKIRVPVCEPTDKMNIIQLIDYGIKMLPLVPRLLYYMHTSTAKYANKFKSKALKEALIRMMTIPEYNIHSLIYVMKSLSLDDAGMVEGGSRRFSFNIRDKFLEKGGNIHYKSEVEEILIENGVARGIKLNGEIIESDFVIAACDAHHTMHKLLNGKVKDSYFESKFKNIKKSPLQTSIQVSYKVKKDMSEYPKMMNFGLKVPFNASDTTVYEASIRNHSFDKTLNKDCSVLTILVDCDDSVYKFLKKLDRKYYKEFKNHVGERLREEVRDYYELEDEEIKLIDVTTPLTYERYCNAYRGSYMAFITTKHVKELMRRGVVRGIKNFFLAGQWIMSPGGLPIALFSGKHAAYRVCVSDKKKFVDLDDFSHVTIFNKVKKK